MSLTRRSLLKAGLVGGCIAAGAPTVSLALSSKSSRQLSILVLGGTRFSGPHIVGEALRRGHSVTLFNRGVTNAHLFPDLERIKGDRGGTLEGLADRRWDAVIDASGYVPRHVENSARLLAPNVSYYLFISSVSAYADLSGANNEDSPLATLEDESVEEVTGETFGGLKVLCEKRALAEIGKERTSIVRPTFICGPGDHTDRFTYYPVRARQGGQMLCPGGPGYAMQLIDVRDLANFIVDSVERETIGVFNTTSPVGAYTLGRLIEDSQAINDTAVEPVWVDDAFLEANDATPLFPMYAPVDGDFGGLFQVSGERAAAAGLEIRPVRETIRDLMAWWATLPDERIANAGFPMTPQREAELIEAWNQGSR